MLGTKKLCFALLSACGEHADQFGKNSMTSILRIHLNKIIIGDLKNKLEIISKKIVSTFHKILEIIIANNYSAVKRS